MEEGDPRLRSALPSSPMQCANTASGRSIAGTIAEGDCVVIDATTMKEKQTVGRAMKLTEIHNNFEMPHSPRHYAGVPERGSKKLPGIPVFPYDWARKRTFLLSSVFLL